VEVVSTAAEPEVLLLVSAPSYGWMVDDKMINSAGKIYEYSIRKSDGRVSLNFTISGTASKWQVGRSLVVGDPYGLGQSYLVISAPTANISGSAQQAGLVRLIKLADIKGDVTLESLPSTTDLAGTTCRGRFGWSCGLVDINHDSFADLWCSEPLRNSDDWQAQEVGGLFIWWGGPTFPTGIVYNASRSADYRIVPDSLRTRLGWRTVWGDLDHKGRLDAVATSVDGVWSRLAGSVHMFLL